MGPNESVYKYFIEQQGISSDCHGGQWCGRQSSHCHGSMGVDVIVTDHHSMPEVLPDAYGDHSSGSILMRIILSII